MASEEWTKSYRTKCITIFWRALEGSQLTRVQSGSISAEETISSAYYKSSNRRYLWLFRLPRSINPSAFLPWFVVFHHSPILQSDEMFQCLIQSWYWCTSGVLCFFEYHKLNRTFSSFSSKFVLPCDNTAWKLRTKLAAMGGCRNRWGLNHRYWLSHLTVVF